MSELLFYNISQTAYCMQMKQNEGRQGNNPQNTELLHLLKYESCPVSDYGSVFISLPVVFYLVAQFCHKNLN